MTANEQEALFEKVRKWFYTWSPEKCSGYVHGVLAEGKYAIPECTLVLNDLDDYARGYLLGFIDARGEDARKEDWHRIVIKKLGFDAPIDFRWWLR